MKAFNRNILVTLLFFGYYILPGNVGFQSNALLFGQDSEAPQLDAIEPDDLVYNAGDGAVPVTKSIRVRDPDNRNLRSAIIRITEGYNRNEDTLLFSDTKTIQGTWNASDGTLTLRGRATVSSYQTALRNVRYENTNTSNPSAQDRKVAFTVNDGDANSNTVTRKIVIKSPNAAPVLSGIETTSLVYCVNAGQVNITSTLTATDPDHANLASAVVQITAGYTRNEDFLRYTPLHGITGSWDAAAGRLSLSGSASRENYTAVLRSVRFENTATAAGSRTIAFTVSDGVSNSNTVNRSILLHGRVTAVISGSATICAHETAYLNVALTGEAPWRFSYRRNSGDPVEVPNVPSNPYALGVQLSGTYTLYEVFDNHCKGTVSGSGTVTVNPSPVVELTGLAPAYDKQTTEWVPITGTPPGGTFSGPGIIPYNQQWYFVPSLPPPGIHNIVYAYQASPGTCYGYDTAVVRILEANAEIEFEQGRKKYCRNDRPFTVTGINLAGAIGTFAISGGIGLTNHGDNTATVYPARLAAGEYTITYTYFDGTTLSVSSKFDVGSAPLADFRWENECFHAGQAIRLTNLSVSNFGNLTDTSFLWKISTATGYDTYTTEHVTYTFAHAGSHALELQIENTYGCTDTLTRILNLRPTISLAEENYFENFDSNPVAWQSGAATVPNVNSWRLGDPPKGFSAPASGTHCWYTYIPVYPAPHEQSWVTSPCFDFTGTEKPMLKMNVWRLFNSNRDGANVQATVDSGKTWILIGQIGDGIEWFNSYNIAGNPGNSSIGWSNDDFLGNDDQWVEARHGLDFLTGKTLVQFRIAYGSDLNAQDNDGIAFDNFWIGERHRTALLEHFTNSSDPDCISPNILVNNLVNANEGNIIDLQYHTAFPGEDPFNQQNPSVPGARAFYYGLADVPYTVLSGGTKLQHRFDYRENPLNGSAAMVETLRDSKFSINLNSSLLGNTIDITAQIYALENIPLTQLTVHLAVVEQVITGVTGNNGETSFESVVKALLPDAAGTTVYQAWNSEEPRLIREAWHYQNIYDYDQLRVVAFIQDESTQEVYQAAIDTIGTISSLDDPPSPVQPKSFMVYPNPAQYNAFIQFSQETREAMSLEFFNNLGQLIWVKQIPAGTREASITLGAYPDGIYWLRLMSRGQLTGTERLVLSRSY
jgi:hypothetical protein